MTEEQWLTGKVPRKLLDYAEVYLKAARTKAGRRKLRLYACACCRRIWASLPEEPHRRAVEAAEAHADGRLDGTGLAAVLSAALPALGGSWGGTAVRQLLKPRFGDSIRADLYAAWAATQPREEARAQADVVRDLFGNPFRPAGVKRPWLTWNGGTVVGLARQIYTERAFDRLPLLADALEDAGCDSADLLDHLRNNREHFVGCWALDLLIHS
jgi:hypothetical protein